MPIKPNKELTERQRDICDYVRNHALTKGYGPSVRDIGDKFKITSPNGIMCHIRALAKKGAMRQAKRNRRALARAWIFPQAVSDV